MKVSRKSFIKSLVILVASPFVPVGIISKVIEPDPWKEFAFPRVRQIHPEMMLKEFVSVKPMGAPDSTVNYMDYE